MISGLAAINLDEKQLSHCQLMLAALSIFPKRVGLMSGFLKAILCHKTKSSYGIFLICAIFAITRTQMMYSSFHVSFFFLADISADRATWPWSTCLRYSCYSHDVPVS